MNFHRSPFTLIDYKAGFGTTYGNLTYLICVVARPAIARRGTTPVADSVPWASVRCWNREGTSPRIGAPLNLVERAGDKAARKCLGNVRRNRGRSCGIGTEPRASYRETKLVQSTGADPGSNWTGWLPGARWLDPAALEHAAPPTRTRLAAVSPCRRRSRGILRPGRTEVVRRACTLPLKRQT